jgi:hypothetical protein
LAAAVAATNTVARKEHAVSAAEALLICTVVANSLPRTFLAAAKLAVAAVRARRGPVLTLAGLANVDTPVAAGDFHAQNLIIKLGIDEGLAQNGIGVVASLRSRA